MDLTDIPTILTLAGLEVVFSAENAIVLAALAQGLPQHQQKKALFYGIAGAFVLRFIAILYAAWIINFWFLQVSQGSLTLGLSEAWHLSTTVSWLVLGLIALCGFFHWWRNRSTDKIDSDN